MIFCSLPHDFSKKHPLTNKGVQYAFAMLTSLFRLIFFLLVAAMAAGGDLHGHDARRAEKIRQRLIPLLRPGLTAFRTVFVLPALRQDLLTVLIFALFLLHAHSSICRITMAFLY